MKAIKLSGVNLAPEIFGDKVVKGNPWAGTRYAKALYIVMTRPLPPWARERFGPGILREKYPNIYAVNQIFRQIAKMTAKTGNLYGTLHAQGYKGKKYLEKRAYLIGRAVQAARYENKTVEQVLAEEGITIGAPGVRPMPTAPAVSPHRAPPRRISPPRI